MSAARRAERLQHLLDVLGGGGLVARHRHVVGVDEPHVDAPRLRRRPDLLGAAGNAGQHGVEEGVVHHLDACRVEARRHSEGIAVHPVRDRGEAVGAVVAGVHRGHHGKQNLRRADVAGGLVPADVLLAGLQRQPVGGRAVGIDRDADQAAGQLSRLLGVHGEVTGVRTAESHWHAEALGGAERDVGADLAGRGDQRHRQQICANRDQRATVVRLADQIGPVDDGATRAWRLDDHAEEIAVGQALAQIGGDDLDAERRGARGEHRRGLCVDVDVDGQPGCRALDRPMHQRHGLRRGGGLVEHRCVGDLEAGQILDHGLEVQQRLQPALADLGLVGGVCGVPRRVLKDVAAQHRWCQRVEVALSDHGHRDRVRVGQRAQFGQRVLLGGRRRQLIESRRQPVDRHRVEDAGGKCLLGQHGKGIHADDLEHRRDGVGIGPDVPVGETGLVVLGRGMGLRTGHGGPLGVRGAERLRSSPSVVDPNRAPERFGDPSGWLGCLSPWAGAPSWLGTGHRFPEASGPFAVLGA